MVGGSRRPTLPSVDSDHLTHFLHSVSPLASEITTLMVPSSALESNFGPDFGPVLCSGDLPFAAGLLQYVVCAAVENAGAQPEVEIV